jgi:hypothetical protein
MLAFEPDLRRSQSAEPRGSRYATSTPRARTASRCWDNAFFELRAQSGLRSLRSQHRLRRRRSGRGLTPRSRFGLRRLFIILRDLPDCRTMSHFVLIPVQAFDASAHSRNSDMKTYLRTRGGAKHGIPPCRNRPMDDAPNACRRDRIHALAFMSTERPPELPDVPTIREAGVADFVVTAWWRGLCGSAGPWLTMSLGRIQFGSFGGSLRLFQLITS